MQLKNKLKQKRETTLRSDDSGKFHSQWTLASASGLSQTWIWAMETGSVNPSDETKDKVATALNCSVSEIWGE